MTSGNGVPVRYTITTPGPVLRQLRDWAAEATALGRRPEFLSILRQVNRSLESNPHGWGDLLRRYPHIRACERRGQVPNWLYVWYGVDDAARLVIVRDVLPAPGSPLTAAGGG